MAMCVRQAGQLLLHIGLKLFLPYLLLGKGTQPSGVSLEPPLATQLSQNTTELSEMQLR